MKLQKGCKYNQNSPTLIDDQKPPDKYSIYYDILKFKETKILEKNIKITLVQLIYMLNQGTEFSIQEREQLILSVVKLLLQNNSGIQRLIYKSLNVFFYVMQMLGVQNYVNIILQSLIMDLINCNQYVRVEALRLLSLISRVEHIFKIERFVQQAIQDKNAHASSTALLLGLKLFKKFPYVVKNWQPEILSQLNQSKQINQHALILLYEINKHDRIRVLNFLKFTRLPQQQLVQLQILKFLKEVSLKSDKKEIFNKEILLFLKQSFHYHQNLIFLEAYSILLQNKDQENIYTYQIYLQFKSIFIPLSNNIEVYKAVQTIFFAIKTYGHTEIIKLKYCIEVGTQSPHPSVSAISILSCFQLQKNQFEICLQQLFNLTSHWIQQDHFLEGLVELVELHPKYLRSAYNSLQLYVFWHSDPNLRISAMKLICIALQGLKNVRDHVLRTLFELSEDSGLVLQQKALLLIFSKCFCIQFCSLEKLSNYKISYYYDYFKQQFEMGSDVFYNYQSQDFSSININCRRKYKIISNTSIIEIIIEQRQSRNMIKNLNQLMFRKVNGLLKYQPNQVD